MLLQFKQEVSSPKNHQILGDPWSWHQIHPPLALPGGNGPPLHQPLCHRSTFRQALFRLADATCAGRCSPGFCLDIVWAPRKKLCRCRCRCTCYAVVVAVVVAVAAAVVAAVFVAVVVVVPIKQSELLRQPERDSRFSHDTFHGLVDEPWGH